MNVSGGQWYLAGPFFNAIQKRWAETIRDLVKKSDQSYYAPVENIFQDGIDGKDTASQVFNANVRNIHASKVILCQLEWLMPPNYMLAVIRETRPKQSGSPSLFSVERENLNLPDMGTVWEMGYALSLKHANAKASARGMVVPPIIVAYCTQKRAQLNLMLAQGCDAFLNGADELLPFIHSKELPENSRFQGGIE